LHLQSTVYRRKDVSKAFRAKKWLYQGRKVKESQLDHPVKKVKARKKRSKGFQTLNSYVDSNEVLPTKYDDEDDIETDNLYARWQTLPWSPPAVGPGDAIPVNEYKNVELALINPGLTHMEQPRLSSVARRLGIPYAPCMCGYEGHKGSQTPTIKGIVVHHHNVELLNEAYLEYQSQLVETEVETRRQDVLKKWRRLVVGILTKDRLDKAYG
jgi:xeroderma pigmentosum group C-complementing protein